MTMVNAPYPGFEYHEFHRRRQQQSSVFLTPAVFGWYQRLLETHRVYFDAERACWLILGYAEVNRVLSDPTTFSSQRELGPDGSNHPFDGLISLDPPRHIQVRALISKAFTPRRVAQFGHGIHSCIGAPLARLKARVALQALLTRFPELRLKRDVPLELKPSWITYGMRHVPVTLG